MGSNETAITIPGAPKKLTFFTGTGRHRVQIAHFFRGLIGSWRPLGVGLVVGSRLYRICRRCARLVLPECSGIKCQVIRGLVGRSAERIGRNMLEAAAHAV